MLKIYLDWNIITHLKDDNDTSKELLNAIRDYHDFFIFPFSAAHLRDLCKGDKNCPGFKKDQDIMEEICGTHLLEYSKETDSAYPYQCTPNDYLERKREEIDLFKSGFTEKSFSTLFAKYGLDFTQFTDSLAMIDVPAVDIPYLNICIRNGKDAFNAVMQLGERFATDDNISKYIGKYIKDNTTEQQYKDIKLAKADTIFQVLDKITIPIAGKAFVDIVRDSMTSQNDSDFFIALYLALSAAGFRIDKKHDFLNVYSDAEHAYYASKCDIFVTNDSKLAEKAQAIYRYLGNHIQIISSDKLKQFMIDIAKHEYDFSYLFNEIVPVFGKPKREEGDLLYYDQLPYPFYGLFNLCTEIEVPQCTTKTVALRKVLRQNGFVYFTELEIFFNCIEYFLDEKDKDVFRKEYRDVFMSRNKERILKVRFSITLGDYLMQLIADPDSLVPLPLMILTQTPAQHDS